MAIQLRNVTIPYSDCFKTGKCRMGFRPSLVTHAFQQLGIPTRQDRYFKKVMQEQAKQQR